MQTAWRDTLATGRQAPGLTQTHYFRVYRLVDHTLPPSATRCKDTPIGPTHGGDLQVARRHTSSAFLLIFGT